MIKEAFVDEKGHLTEAAKNLMEQLLQNMQQNLSNEGLVSPGVSSAANSVDPPQAGGQLGIIQNGTDEQGSQIALKGTIVFDPAVVNGGSGAAPNGQLKVLLNDGIFHPITNT
jgi:hypothetical protein